MEAKVSSPKAAVSEGSSRSAAMMQLQMLLSNQRSDPPDLVQDRGDYKTKHYSSDSALPILQIPRTDRVIIHPILLSPFCKYQGQTESDLLREER